MVRASEGQCHGASAASQEISKNVPEAPIPTREEEIMAGMHPKLKSVRLKRQRARASKRYRLRHSHKVKTGHRFIRNTAYASIYQICAVCGRNR